MACRDDGTCSRRVGDRAPECPRASEMGTELVAGLDYAGPPHTGVRTLVPGSIGPVDVVDVARDRRPRAGPRVPVRSVAPRGLRLAVHPGGGLAGRGACILDMPNMDTPFDWCGARRPNAGKITLFRRYPFAAGPGLRVPARFRQKPRVPPGTRGFTISWIRAAVARKLSFVLSYRGLPPTLDASRPTCTTRLRDSARRCPEGTKLSSSEDTRPPRKGIRP